MQWQPIETAPKDGRPVIVRLDEGEIIVARFSRDKIGTGWWDEHANSCQSWADANATHWMPLPDPPTPPTSP